MLTRPFLVYAEDLMRNGDYYMIDDLTGFREKRSNMVKRWDGMWVRKKSAEGRHPQEFPLPLRRETPPPVTRSEPAYTFVELPYETPAPFDPTTLGPGNQPGGSL